MLLMRPTAVAIRSNAAWDAGQAELALVGQRKHAIGPVEQRDAEEFLQHFHLVADRRRRDVELMTRPDEAQMARRGLEAAERVERRQPGGRGFRGTSDQGIPIRRFRITAGLLGHRRRRC